MTSERMRERQSTRESSGRYRGMGQCVVCNAPMGAHSHSIDLEGGDGRWHTAAHATCVRCWNGAQGLMVEQFPAYQEARRAGQRPAAAGRIARQEATR